MSRSLRVLIVEDSVEDASRVLQELRRGGYQPIFHRVSTAEGMSLSLARQSWDLIIADTTLPHLPGDAAKKLLKRSGMNVPLVLRSDKPERSNGSPPASAEAIKFGKGNLRKFLSAVKRKTRPLHRRRRRSPTVAMLRYLVDYDPLTDLPNRNLFYEQLQRAIRQAQSNKRPFGLLVLGLDRFREINHTLGPQNGDLLLTQVARRFEDASEQCTLKARLGGDEFAAVFPQAGKQDVETICANVLRALDSPFVVRDLPIDLSGSVGVACFPDHGADANFLIQRAHIALAMAKQSERDYAVYDFATDPYGQQKLVYLGGLRNAIEHDQLILHYQPKVGIKTRRTHGVEALVRWNHPQLGLVPPYEFIAVAERTGQIHALGRWVLRVALDQCRTWRQAGLDIPVAVNLSPRNFHDRHLAEYIAQLLEERAMPSRCLELEITENVIMTDAAHVLEILNQLSRMGIQAYIDDFGTGYSSLGHLKKLPVAGIKIDKSFVSQMTVDDNDAVIVRSTIDLGHNLGLKVIAEGVESAEIWDRLQSLGCDAAQGYFMSRPRPAAELEHWFAESPWGIKKSPHEFQHTVEVGR